MPEVTINAADLEALLFAAGAANASPEAKKILKRDPQFEQVESRLSDAVKNAGDLWRRASRKEEFPERFIVAPNEIAFLKSLAAKGADRRFGMEENIPIDRRYITKSLVELGVYTEQVIWPNSGEDRFQHVTRRVRLTYFAAEAIAKYDEECVAQSMRDSEAMRSEPGFLSANRWFSPAPEHETTILPPVGQKDIYGSHDFSAGDLCAKCRAPRLHVEDGLIGPKCAGVVVIKPRIHETDVAGTIVDMSGSFDNLDLPTTHEKPTE